MSGKVNTQKTQIQESESDSKIVTLEDSPRKPLAFSLPKKKVFVRYVKTPKGNILNPKHIAYGGKLEGAFDSVPPKKDRSGRYVNILTDIERAFLEKELSMNEGDLSIYKKDNNYYADLDNIILTKEGKFLDLSIPDEYIKYKVLLSYEDYISPSVTETINKKTYKYEMVFSGDEELVARKSIDYKRAAYKILDLIENSRDKLVMAIRLGAAKKVSSESDHDWLIGQVGMIIDKDPKRFCEIMNDKGIETKFLIEKAIDAKAIFKNRGLYTTADGMDLCYEGYVATLDNAIEFLNDPKNQDIKLLIQAKIKQ